MKYCVIPYSASADEKSFCITAEGYKTTLAVRFAEKDAEAEFHFPIPENASFALDNKEYFPVLTEERDGKALVKGYPRPLLGFSPRLGWMNDPNGLFFYSGKWHLFYQHNPVGAVWSNMSWGHAASRDLVNWDDMGIALFPDDMGTEFSGSAIVDYENASGLGTEDTPAILLFYTAAGGANAESVGKGFTQCLAYSTDGGNTFVKYARNPIIPLVHSDNRDPKVVRDGKGGYLLALYLADEKMSYGIFRSEDLLHWEMTQTLLLPGDAECPDLYPMEYEGTTKWVFSGAKDIYYTGDVKDGVFTPDSVEPKRLHDAAGCGYAAQTWSDAPDGRRVKVWWNQWNGIPFAGPYRGCMSTPCDIKLKNRNGVPTLCAEISPEVIASFKSKEKLKGVREYETYAGSTFLAEVGGDSDFTLEASGIIIVRKDGAVYLNGKELKKGVTGKVTVLSDGINFELFADDGSVFALLAEINEKHGNLSFVSGSGSDLTIYKK